jgi:hypothetical protein
MSEVKHRCRLRYCVGLCGAITFFFFIAFSSRDGLRVVIYSTMLQPTCQSVCVYRRFPGVFHANVREIVHRRQATESYRSYNLISYRRRQSQLQ